MDEHLKNNYYNLLGITQKASQDDIRKAYLKLARLYHPDHNLDSKDRRMIELNHIYEVLSNPVKKREYDSRFAKDTHYDFTTPPQENSDDDKPETVPVRTSLFKSWHYKEIISTILIIFLVYLGIFLIVKILGTFTTIPDWVNFIIPK
jgi:curved DNA-binding protein CbpA